jgi:outer membrane murein-binding lipoprotein Lpp
VGTLKSDVGTLKSDVGTLKSDVGTLKSDVGTLKSDVAGLNTRFDSLDYKFDCLQFDVRGLRDEMETGFAIVNDQFGEMLRHIDGLVRSDLRLDTEDVALRSRQDRLEERVMRLERKIG